MSGLDITAFMVHKLCVGIAQFILNAAIRVSIKVTTRTSYKVDFYGRSLFNCSQFPFPDQSKLYLRYFKFFTIGSMPKPIEIQDG